MVQTNFLEFSLYSFQLAEEYFHPRHAVEGKRAIFSDSHLHTIWGKVLHRIAVGQEEETLVGRAYQRAAEIAHRLLVRAIDEHIDMVERHLYGGKTIGKQLLMGVPREHHC